MTNYIHFPSMQPLRNNSNQLLSYCNTKDSLMKLDIVTPKCQPERTVNANQNPSTDDNSNVDDIILKFSTLNKNFIALDDHHDRSFMLHSKKSEARNKRRRRCFFIKKNSFTASDVEAAAAIKTVPTVISRSNSSHDKENVGKTKNQSLRRRILQLLRLPLIKSPELRHHKDHHFEIFDHDENTSTLNIIGMEILIWSKYSASDPTLEFLLHDDNSSIVSSLSS